MTNFLPVNLRINDRRVLVVGGGSVAHRKCEVFAELGIPLRVIAEVFSEQLPWETINNVERITASYAPEHLEGIFLVVAATDNQRVNARIVEDAHKHGLLCQSVDNPDASDFHLSALLRRDDLTIAFSTNGKSPALARVLRDRAEPHYDESLGKLLEQIAQLRHSDQWKRLTLPQRREYLQQVLDDPQLFQKLANSRDLKDV